MGPKNQKKNKDPRQKAKILTNILLYFAKRQKENTNSYLSQAFLISLILSK
jgi:hypothetical protein